MLSVLADGAFHSGASLGNAMGVSRTAVWKHVERATQLGVVIERVKGLGYRIPGGLEVLDRERIWRQMSVMARDLLTELAVIETVDSTNTYVRDQMADGKARLAVITEMQTAGRGRQGRQWVSPFGKNLYLSVGWSFEDGAATLQGLSLAVGVAAYRALANTGVGQLGLKWPNDILRNHHKLGGILLEMTGDPVGSCRVVVGIGINVAMPISAAADIGQPWADLQDMAPSRNVLAAAILSELVLVLHTYPRLTFAGYRDEWERYDAYSGARVRVSTPLKVVEGVVLGVGANGALRLDVNGQEQEFHGGEISLRGIG
ncbi:MAG: biotin--[acetyl-CoA-carboxylase] ligase [Porticoccaceae bacterium]